MQINWPYNEKEGPGAAGYAPMWYAPTPWNTALDINVPPVYGPYADYGYWPPSILESRGNMPTLTQAVAASVAPSTQSPAPTPAGAGSTGNSLAPISLVSPMPSIVQAPGTVTGDQVSSMVPAPSAMCRLTQWVNQNPMLAAGSAIAVYFLLAGGKRR